MKKSVIKLLRVVVAAIVAPLSIIPTVTAIDSLALGDVHKALYWSFVIAGFAAVGMLIIGLPLYLLAARYAPPVRLLNAAIIGLLTVLAMTAMLGGYRSGSFLLLLCFEGAFAGSVFWFVAGPEQNRLATPKL